MKVIYHDDFCQCYTTDPAAAHGRMEAVVKAISGRVDFIQAKPAGESDISDVHTESHIALVEREGLYDIAALAAGGAIMAAEIGMSEPAFALIRPPGHHASAGSAWGFCYFNNMAIALERLKRERKIVKAFLLDFDLHFGDGTVNIMERKGYVTIHNPSSSDRNEYLRGIERGLSSASFDIIGVSAGFDNHKEDWGGLLTTEDYKTIGHMVWETGQKKRCGCFAVLEGGYNHRVLGENVLAFLEGMEGG
ncbi:histone deacetylase family protein [Syntrophus buswellii]|uniref:histone deacetylase family protein n=1 Tax=Syntrophus buswellii TaxID=43774 RepID=UPI002A3E5243|nr:histone deacetylase family protein [Syntrophus sp. (in: bacteria)]